MGTTLFDRFLKLSYTVVKKNGLHNWLVEFIETNPIMKQEKTLSDSSVKTNLICQEYYW